MTKKSKPTAARKEATSPPVASDAGYITGHGDAIINDVLAQVHDVEVRARLKKYHRCAKAVAASALTQKE